MERRERAFFAQRGNVSHCLVTSCPWEDDIWPRPKDTIDGSGSALWGALAPTSPWQAPRPSKGDWDFPKC